MAQKERSKELWLIPKRVSLHQTICLIDGILKRRYDGTSWNPQKQNDLGVNLKQWGATNNGKNISLQAIRTLVASIPQYLGFLYINTNTTPNTICLTEAGKKLLEKHKKNLTKIKNLREGKEYLITTSDMVLLQMEKLQLTNPIYAKDCENISVFPFRMTLKLLLELDYLDREEIAYFLFKIKDESEFELIVQEIKLFRKHLKETRKILIDTFKKTHIGNITLVQAPSTAYYEKLCEITGIIEQISITPLNRNKINAIKLKDYYIPYVKDIINTKYFDIEPFDFGNNLKLWIDYIGNPKRICPPTNIEITNSSNHHFFIKVEKEESLITFDLIKSNTTMLCPMFLEEEYRITIIDCKDGKELSTNIFIPKNKNQNYDISPISNYPIKEKTIEQLAEVILKHSECNSFCLETLNYLKILEKNLKIDKIKDKSLRGAYYEYFFFKLLTKLKAENIIDDVIWNGKIGKYGLPTSAPGGKEGQADMYFVIEDKIFILELTTIKSKSGQESAEIASVPDHIRLAQNKTNQKICGIFCAPKIHERNTIIMKTVLKEYNINLNCLTDKELIDIFLTKNKKQIYTLLSNAQ